MADIRLGGAYFVFSVRDRGLERRFNQIATSTNRIGNSFDRLNRSVRGFNQNAGRLLAVFGALSAGNAIANVARSFVEIADSITLARARLRLVSSSNEQATKTFNSLFRIAQQTRQQFGGLTFVFARFARATERFLGDAAGGAERLLRFTEGISQAIIISGATVKEANAGLIQFSQALAVGVLRGDELRAVAEQLPRITKAIADGLGITIGQLRELSEAGILTSRLLIRAFETQLPKLRAEFEQIPVTVAQALVRTRNIIEIQTDRINRSQGLTSSLVESINRFNNAISNIDNLKTFGDALASIVNAISFIINNFEFVLSVTIRGLLSLFLLMRTNIGTFQGFGRAARLTALQIRDDFRTISGANFAQDLTRAQGRNLTLFSRFLSSLGTQANRFARDTRGTLDLSRIIQTPTARTRRDFVRLVDQFGNQVQLGLQDIQKRSEQTIAKQSTDLGRNFERAQAQLNRRFDQLNQRIGARITQRAQLQTTRINRAVNQEVRQSIERARGLGQSFAQINTGFAEFERRVANVNASNSELGRQLRALTGNYTQAASGSQAWNDALNRSTRFTLDLSQQTTTFRTQVSRLSTVLSTSLRLGLAVSVTGFRLFAGAIRLATGAMLGFLRVIPQLLVVFLASEAILGTIKFIVRAVDEFNKGTLTLASSGKIATDIFDEFLNLFRSFENLNLGEGGGVQGLFNNITEGLNDIPIDFERANIQKRLDEAFKQAGADIEKRLASIRADIARVGQTTRQVFEIDIRESFTKFFDQERGKIQGAIDSLNQQRRRIRAELNVADLIGLDEDTVGELREQYQRIGSTLNEATASLDEFLEKEKEFFTGDAPTQFRAQLQTLLNAFDELEEKRNSFSVRLVNAFDGIADAFGRFAGAALTNFAKIEDAARQLAQTIITELLKALIIDPFTKALADGFRSFIQGFAGSGLSRIGSFLGGILPFQNGGLAPPGLALVGERGPEILQLQNPARVYSNADLSEALGGMGVHLTQIIESTDGPGVRRALAEATPNILQAAQALNTNNLSRPSADRQAILGR